MGGINSDRSHIINFHHVILSEEKKNMKVGEEMYEIITEIAGN